MATRIHVGTREPLTRAGGLRHYIGALAAGQRRIGHSVVLLDRITRSGGSTIADGSAELLSTAADLDSSVLLHFAQSAFPLLQRRSWVARANCRVCTSTAPGSPRGGCRATPSRGCWGSG